MRLAIHVGDDPESFTARLRALASEVDPTAIILNPLALNEVRSGDAYLMVWMRLGAGILTAVLLALAASGIYAIMSFAVAECTREIGIRAALGAQRSNIVSTVAMRSIAPGGFACRWEPHRGHDHCALDHASAHQLPLPCRA